MQTNGAVLGANATPAEVRTGGWERARIGSSLFKQGEGRRFGALAPPPSITSSRQPETAAAETCCLIHQTQSKPVQPGGRDHILIDDDTEARTFRHVDEAIHMPDGPVHEVALGGAVNRLQFQ